MAHGTWHTRTHTPTHAHARPRTPTQTPTPTQTQTQTHLLRRALGRRHADVEHGPEQLVVGHALVGGRRQRGRVAVHSATVPQHQIASVALEHHAVTHVELKPKAVVNTIITIDTTTIIIMSTSAALILWHHDEIAIVPRGKVDQPAVPTVRARHDAEASSLAPHVAQRQ
eukprot:1916359-Pleurochrysis_carterae.AAC.1